MAAGGPAGISAAMRGDEPAAAALDRIDLYQLHRIDAKVPVEETLGALKDLQKAGKIRHIGLSEVSRGGDRAGAEDRGDRQRAESVQPRRPQARRRGRLLREA